MEKHKTELDSKRVLLFEERGPTSRFIQARIEDDGKLVVEGQDVGAMPLKCFDDGDYEFFVTVRAEDKDQLLLALIQKVFGGNFKAVDAFREYLKEKGISFEWMTW